MEREGEGQAQVPKTFTDSLGREWGVLSKRISTRYPDIFLRVIYDRNDMNKVKEVSESYILREMELFKDKE